MTATRHRVLGILAAAAALTAWSVFAQTTRLVHGRLLPCPNEPNCVSSQATDEVHRVEAIPYIGNPAEARDRLQRVLEAMPRMRVVSGGPRHLHVTFTSKWLRLTDDVDFLFDSDARLIHVRSASRDGQSDNHGANRKRVEEIRAAYERADPGS